MASRSKPERRPERGGDSLEAIKPLIVLALFGTILYGAYSVVQKGPSKDHGSQASATEAPPFAPPAVELPPQPAAPAAPAVALPAAPPALAPPAPPPPAATVAQQPFAAPPMGTAPGAPPAITPPTLPADPPAAPLAAPPAADSAALAATAAGLTAAAAATAADAIANRSLAPPVAAASPPLPAPPAAASAGPPTYLAAVSAPPPVQDDALAAVASGGGEDRPDRLALATRGQVPPSLPPEMPPPPGTLPSSAAFTTAWADAHDKLAAGRYAEALTALSVWYDDPALGLEESHRLEDLLGQLAGTVIYSQQDLLMPPHVVAPGETLPAIAAPLGVSWQLLAKINGVSDPMQLIPGEHLKVIRGPFDAVVSVARRRLSLQVNGAYAGSFPVVVGREFLPRVGSSLPVAETRRDAAAGGPSAGSAILLADGLVVQAADDPAVVADDAAPGSLIVSARDFAELVDLLGPGSSVLVRQ